MPLYLLDSNIFITSNDDNYPVEMFPEVWHWLEHYIAKNIFKMCRDNFKEIEMKGDKKNSDFGRFLEKNRRQLLLPEMPDPVLVRKVLAECYAVGDDFDYVYDDEGKKRTKKQTDKLDAMGNDAILVQEAARDPKNRVVVTYERSGGPPEPAPSRKIPVVCKQLNIRCLNLLQLFN